MNLRRGFDYAASKQHWSMRKENDYLLSRGRLAEETNAEEAVMLHKQALFPAARKSAGMRPILKRMGGPLL
jgi:predicted GNAT family N-acyltransferase